MIILGSLASPVSYIWHHSMEKGVGTISPNITWLLLSQIILPYDPINWPLVYMLNEIEIYTLHVNQIITILLF